MTDRPQVTIRRHDRVRFRYGQDGRIGRVIETTHRAAVVWWAPTLEHLQAQERLPPDRYWDARDWDAQDSIHDGTYSLRDLEHVR